jgi:putative oxidoreductase
MIDSRMAPYATLLLRIALGVLFLAHGLIKIFIITVPDFIAYAGSAGYSAPVAVIVLLVELAGGLALLAGLWTRWVALILFVETLGVIILHWPYGFLFASVGGGWEYPAVRAVALLALSLLGDGPYALTPWVKVHGLGPSASSHPAVGPPA